MRRNPAKASADEADVTAAHPTPLADARSSLARGLAILDLVAYRGQVRVGELASLLDVPLSTVYRYVRQLRDGGYLNEVDGYYCLGLRFQTAAERRRPGHLVQVAGPLLRALTDVTGEASILTVRVRTTALCLERIMPVGRYLLSFQRGTVRPLHAGASATVLLAYAPLDVLACVQRGTLRRFTAHTPDAAALNRLLGETHERGFVVSYGEVDPGMVGVAAPAFRGDSCVCGVSIAGPEDRLQGQKLDAAIAAVVDTSRRLSESLQSAAGANAWIPDGAV